jgi:hypothetical protein
MLDLIAKGASAKEIADRCDVKIGAVYTARNTYKKMHGSVPSVPEAPAPEWTTKRIAKARRIHAACLYEIADALGCPLEELGEVLELQKKTVRGMARRGPSQHTAKEDQAAKPKPPAAPTKPKPSTPPTKPTKPTQSDPYKKLRFSLARDPNDWPNAIAYYIRAGDQYLHQTGDAFTGDIAYAWRSTHDKLVALISKYPSLKRNYGQPVVHR